MGLKNRPKCVCPHTTGVKNIHSYLAVHLFPSPWVSRCSVSSRDTSEGQAFFSLQSSRQVDCTQASHLPQCTVSTV